LHFKSISRCHPGAGYCYSDGDYDTAMMECSECGGWIHAHCEGIDGEEYQVLSFLPDSVSYVCKCSTPAPADIKGVVDLTPVPVTQVTEQEDRVDWDLDTITSFDLPPVHVLTDLPAPDPEPGDTSPKPSEAIDDECDFVTLDSSVYALPSSFETSWTTSASS